jgi:hypothetical protein
MKYDHLCRLRELLMTATKTIATPTMSLPVGPKQGQAQALADSLRCIQLPELVAEMTMKERSLVEDNMPVRHYTIFMKFKENFPCGVTLEELFTKLENVFLKNLLVQLRAEMRKTNASGMGKCDERSLGSVIVS